MKSFFSLSHLTRVSIILLISALFFQIAHPSTRYTRTIVSKFQHDNTLSEGAKEKLHSIQFQKFLTLKKLGGGIAGLIFLIMLAGIFVIVRQLYQWLIDRFHGRLLLGAHYRRLSVLEMNGLVNKHPNSATSLLFSRLLNEYQVHGNRATSYREIASYIKTQKNSFIRFRNRLAFLADIAAALGLLGTVWIMFVFYFESSPEKQHIPVGAGLALITTFSGMLASSILSLGNKKMVNYFNKHIDLISKKADEFRFWLLFAGNKQNKPTNKRKNFRSLFLKRRKAERDSNRATFETLKLNAVSESHQDGFIGQSLMEPITIQVVTEQGKKVTGVPIHFEISQGDGLLENQSSVAWVKTGKKGIAMMGWIMGQQVGPQRLRVSILNDQEKQLEFVSFAKPVISENIAWQTAREKNSIQYKTM